MWNRVQALVGDMDEVLWAIAHSVVLRPSPLIGKYKVRACPRLDFTAAVKTAAGIITMSNHHWAPQVNSLMCKSWRANHCQIDSCVKHKIWKLRNSNTAHKSD